MRLRHDVYVCGHLRAKFFINKTSWFHARRLIGIVQPSFFANLTSIRKISRSKVAAASIRFGRTYVRNVLSRQQIQQRNSTCQRSDVACVAVSSSGYIHIPFNSYSLSMASSSSAAAFPPTGSPQQSGDPMDTSGTGGKTLLLSNLEQRFREHRRQLRSATW